MSNNIITPTITTQGLRSIFDAHQAGLNLELTHIALGSGAYTPEDTQTALQDEKQRVMIAGGEVQGDTQIHITALLDGDSEYWASEVGFYAGDILFAVYSHPENKIAWKNGNFAMMVGFDLSLDAVPPDVVTINVNGEDNMNLSLASPMITNAANHIKVLTELLEIRYGVAA